MSGGVKSPVIRAAASNWARPSPNFTAHHGHTLSALSVLPVTALRRRWSVTIGFSYLAASYLSSMVNEPPGSTPLQCFDEGAAGGVALAAITLLCLWLVSTLYNAALYE
jgi:hypothetical protein